MPAAALPDLSALDIDALRAMVLEQHAVIERLQTMIAHLRRMQFGRKSEKIERQVEQLELELEELESAKAAQLEELERKLEPAKAAAVAAVRKPVRRPLPDHLPREVETHMPAEQGCPACGAELNSSAKMFRKYWNGFRQALKSSGMFDRRCAALSAT